MNEQFIIVVIILFISYTFYILEPYRDLVSRAVLKSSGGGVYSNSESLSYTMNNPDLYYNKIYANRDYVIGELIDEWKGEMDLESLSRLELNKQERRTFGADYNPVSLLSMLNGKRSVGSKGSNQKIRINRPNYLNRINAKREWINKNTLRIYAIKNIKKGEDIYIL